MWRDEAERLYSEYVINWAVKFEERFPLCMGEAEMTRDFEERKDEYFRDLCEAINELVEDARD